MSNCSYLFNMIGPLVGCHALRDQCCRVLSALLLQFNMNPSANITCMLGEQLQAYILSFLVFWTPGFLFRSVFNSLCTVQFLVSTLVACCIPSETKESCSSTTSQVLSLLRMLTVDTDSSMYDFVKVSFCYLVCICSIRDLLLLYFVDVWN